MNSEELNTQLYDRLNAELQEFIGSLKTSTPELVIEQAYELVIKEDIVMALECDNIEPKQCKALLKETVRFRSVLKMYLKYGRKPHPKNHHKWYSAIYLLPIMTANLMCMMICEKS